MYGTFCLVITLSATTLLPFAHMPLATPHTVTTDERLRSASPSVVENGKNFIALPFPTPLPPYTSDVAFTPDGTAYFINEGTAGFGYANLFTRVSPSGAYSSISMPRAAANTPDLIFARGDFWMAANPGGILKVSTDGSRVRWFPLPGVDIEAIVYGNDGTIYLPGSTSDLKTGAYTGHLVRIDRKNVITSMPLSVTPFGAAAFGADGKFYFAYVDALFSHDGIARLESNGTTKLFPIVNPIVNAAEYRIESMVSANGKLYFVDQFKQIFGSLAPSGPAVTIPMPASIVNPQPAHVAADFGGNVWLDIRSFTNALYSNVYQFNTYTGRFNGPYSTGNPAYAKFIDGGPYVGPDDNIWMKLAVGGDFRTVPLEGYAAALGIIVRHVQTLEPASLTITAARATSFTILETHFNGPWTARSLSPAVAAVSPSSSATGAFSVSETGPGMASIAVTDHLGNVSYELVTAQ